MKLWSFFQSLSAHKTGLIFFFILSFSFLTRFYNLGAIFNYYFDEQYHVPAAKLILYGNVSAFEWWHTNGDKDYPLFHDPHAINDSNFDWLHPPLAKYFQAFSMNVFGENSWAWRLPSAVFGVSVVGIVYLLAELLFKDKKLSLLASFLVSMSGLLLVQSRIAMNDIFVTFLILGTVYFYWKTKFESRKKIKEKNKYYLPSGIFLGLAVATKWSAIFIGIYFIFNELFYFIKNKSQNELKKIPWKIFSLIIVPILIYLIVYLPMFLGGKDFTYFIELHKQILSYQFARDTNHVYQSRPWEWFLNLRPVWYWKLVASSSGLGSSEGKAANIYALENPVLALGGIVAVLASLVKITFEFFKKQKKSRLLDSQITHLLIAYAVTWLPWIFSPRILFYYHYTPAVPFLSIILAFWLRKLWQKKNRQGKIAVISFLILAGIVFWVYYPHWTGLPVSKTFAQKVYFGLPSWK